MKILVGIISCGAHRSTRLRGCLDTWGKDIGDLIIFSGEAGEENKLFFLPVLHASCTTFLTIDMSQDPSSLIGVGI